jgi:hypothetical protein
MDENREVWPTFIGLGAVGVVVGALMWGSQLGEPFPAEGAILFGTLLGLLGFLFLNAGLIGVAVKGLPPKRGPAAALPLSVI